MPEFSEGASAMAQRKLEKLGVRVILNQRGLADEERKVVVLESLQEELEADKIISVVGLGANNSFVRLDGVTNQRGFFKTDEYFRLEGSVSYNNIFAYGDCAEKLRNAAYLVMQNGPIVAHNVKALLDGLESDNLRAMDEGFSGGMVTIGPHDGVAQLPFTYTQFLLPRFKNSTMMFPSSKPLMGIHY